MDLFYDEDLAYIHHVGFGDFSEQAGEELLKIFRNSGIHSGLVIDLGCGSGIWANKLINNGYSVLGVDISEKMINIAGKTAPQARFVISSMYEAELCPCQAVTALGEGFNYCPFDINPLKQITGLLKKISSNLQLEGIFAFDIIVKSESEEMRYRSWKKGLDWAVLTEVAEDRENHTLKREITIFREINGTYRRSMECHKIQVFDQELIVKLLKQNGFEVTVSNKYGNYALGQRRSAFIARKIAI